MYQRCTPAFPGPGHSSRYGERMCGRRDHVVGPTQEEGGRADFGKAIGGLQIPELTGEQSGEACGAGGIDPTANHFPGPRIGPRCGGGNREYANTFGG